MRSDLKLIEKIDNYILGKLSVEEKELFEKEIASNETLTTQVEEQRLIIQAVKRKALRAEIEKAGGSGGNSLWLISGIVLIVALAGTLLYMSLSGPDQRPADNVPVTLEEIVPEEPVVSDTGSEASDIVSRQTDQPPVPVSEDETFHGLKTWVRPEVQTYNVNAQKGAAIEGKNGTLVIIPEQAFLDENGNPVEGQVEFQLVEALTLDDMLLYNLTTMSGSKPLETGGMLFVNAVQKEKPLTINPARPLYIEIPTEEKKPEMMAFKGEVTDEGNVDWKDPKPLKKFLVKVDFSELDFLPEGFVKAIREEGRQSRFYTTDREKVDSIYYSLAYQKNRSETVDTAFANKIAAEEVILEPFTNRRNKGRRRERFEPMDTVDTPVASETDEATSDMGNPACGVDPLTIKTIKTPEFQETFLATKEFEERVRYIHTLDNGQEIIDIYINNLGKQLWEVDEVALDKVPEKAKAKFTEFVAMKLTNLKDAQIYQEKLSGFYNARRKKYREHLEKLQEELRQKDREELSRLNRELRELQEKAREEYNAGLQQKIRNRFASVPGSSVAIGNAYAFQWAEFGWVNIDMYLKMIASDPQIVTINVNDSRENLKVYQWLNTLANLTPLRMNKNSWEARFPKKGRQGSAKMKNTYCLAIAREGDQFYWGRQNFNPYESTMIDVEVQPADLQTIKSNLAALSANNKPLIKQLQKFGEEAEVAEKELERIQKIRERQQKQYREIERKYTDKKVREIQKVQMRQREHAEFVNKMRAVCFPCVRYVSAKQRVELREIPMK